MVMVLVRLFCAFVRSPNLFLYEDKYNKITLRWGYRHYLVTHSGLHHTNCKNVSFNGRDPKWRL